MQGFRKSWIVLLGLVAGAQLATAVAGCSIVGAMRGVTVDNMRAAHKRGDAATLKKHCDEGRERSTRSVMRGKATEAEVEACRLLADLNKANDRAERDKAFAAFRDALTCDNVMDSFNAYLAKWKPAVGDFSDTFMAAGRKLHECDDYKTLVTQLFPLGRKRGLAQYTTGYSLLKDLGAEGLPVAEKLSNFAKTSDFSFKGGWIAADAIARWLMENKVYEPCDSFVGALSSSQWGAVDSFAVYLGRAKCKSAVQPLVKHLASENGDLRETVCIALGRIGDPSVKGKVAIVASNDGAFRTDNIGLRHYYVRDACRQALGKLKLAE
jgi:hypothetical protein